jgi:hypothetical protein
MKDLANPMGEKPIVGSLLSLAGAFLLLAGSLFVANPIIFFGSVVSGLLDLAFGVMLYRKPGKHSLWSTALIAVSIFDLLGVMYFFYASSAEALMFTVIAEIGPLVCLIGGLAGLLWKATPRVPSGGSKPPAS